MARKSKPKKDSEVRAYAFIKENLKLLGWDTRNPERSPTGQVWTQHEALSNDILKKGLGRVVPENVIKVGERHFWVLEAKPDHKDINLAVKEAKEYAEKLIAKGVKAHIISGVAGNDADLYLVRTEARKDGKWHPVKLNQTVATGLLNQELAQRVFRDGPEIKEVPVNEAMFLAKAEKINEILHLGAINLNYRARVMSALLLAMIHQSPINLDDDPMLLIKSINDRAAAVLKSQGKEGFKGYVEIALPPTEDNHKKFKKALVQTIQELDSLNIRSAMNSGTDVLGRFYEVFLKYGNGAKEIGIVLTPRHITSFAVRVLDVREHDVVYDPTCGTGGFLVAALDKVRQTATPQMVDRFKQNNIYGVEQDTEVVALALVNMIFRGDGKNHIVDGNTFQKNLRRTSKNGGPKAEFTIDDVVSDDAPVTRTLMNPPFALKSDQDKEYKFVDHALRQMSHGGLLFAVLPYGALVKPSGYFTWRKERLLVENSLLAVITFPDDLFYPVAVHSVGIVVKKGVPHPAKQNVLWVRAIRDGLLKSKGKRLPSDRAKDDYPSIEPTVRAFVADPSLKVKQQEMFLRACPIDMSDELLELVPENYLLQKNPTEREIVGGLEGVIRDALAFMIRTGAQQP